MFNNIFNPPSRSYAQKQNHHRTPPKSKRPTEVPLPPSPPPPDSAQQTPLFGIDHALALSPATDTLATPGRTPMSRVGQDDGLLTTNTLSTFGLNTPTKSRDGDSTNESGKSSVPVLEDFELIRVVGKGCAGRVMMVRHTETAKIQAMKAISKRSVLTYDELDHTLTEVRILKQFAKYEPNNPFVVKLNYAFMDKENIYFVMDFYPGGDLATQMEIGRLGHTRTRFYAVDITQGLIDLHRHGIIVRDLKPENILLKSDGHAVLADFGLSKQFSYRGEPAPVTIPIYPGQPSLPYWAGAGLGSVRPNYNGRPRIMIDRAESFVGTAEYIAPEVVKRAEYTYAVDWWALGIILIEGLFGRVPYRQHADEPPTMLWDQILLDPWQVIFDHHDVARIDLHEENIDAPTLEFIDGKDANHRLTEPCVVQHPFFYGIEWDMVISGGYVDPSPLTLHPVPEYNLHYFPRLCLQETPTVDMTAHDSERPEVDDVDPTRKTPLNDPLTYAMEHRRAREAFKDFEWSRDDVIDWQHGADREGRHSSAVDGDDGHGYEGEEEEEADGEEYAETDGIDGLTLNWSVSEAADQLAGAIQDLDMPAIPGLGAGDIDYDSEGATPPTSTDFTPRDGLVNSIDNDVVPASTVLPSSDELPNGDGETHLSPHTSRPIEISSPPLSPTRESIPPTSPKTIKVPSPRPKTKLRLPSGLPASGLSSSDIVSIPSPDPNSPTRLVRRNPLGLGHASRPSIDTVHTLAMANPRLSVDLHGTISQLGDEDWEKLETGSIPSIPNAAPSAFFTRGFGTLRRRPSAINTAGGGGFRRPHKNSGSSNSASGDSSPTKGNSRHRQLFTVKSIENTKKAFKTLKAFPRMISHSKPRPQSGGQAKSTTPSRVTTPTSPPVPRIPAKYGPVSAPATATGTGSWFTNRRLGISRSFRPSRSNTTSSSASTGSSTKTSAYAHPALNAVTDREVKSQGQKEEVPRVELIHSPPVDWDLSSGATKNVGETKAGGGEGKNGGDGNKQVQGEGGVVVGETKESTEKSTAEASA